MSINNKNGFTVIELILFIGVGGLLFVGLLAGSGMAVSGQRYRDSVQSLQAVIQQQYSEVANVFNDRGDNLTCASSGAITGSTSGATPRGTSNSCMLMGRYIQSYKSASSLSDGQALHIYPVIASASTDLPSNTSTDLEAFSHYNLEAYERGYEEERVEWGNLMRARLGSGSDNDKFSILILRSPLTGTIRTYAHVGSYENSPGVLLSSPDSQQALTVCIDTPDTNALAGEIMAIRISAGASNQSGVEMLSESQGNGC